MILKLSQLVILLSIWRLRPWAILWTATIPTQPILVCAGLEDCQSKECSLQLFSEPRERRKELAVWIALGLLSSFYNPFNPSLLIFRFFASVWVYTLIEWNLVYCWRYPSVTNSFRLLSDLQGRLQPLTLCSNCRTNDWCWEWEDSGFSLCGSARPTTIWTHCSFWERFSQFGNTESSRVADKLAHKFVPECQMYLP